MPSFGHKIIFPFENENLKWSIGKESLSIGLTNGALWDSGSKLCQKSKIGVPGIRIIKVKGVPLISFITKFQQIRIRTFFAVNLLETQLEVHRALA